MTPTRRTALILFTLAVSVRIFFHGITGFTADDALITFRYASNLIHGDGFVYNPGQAVLGTSTPLFTLILAALGSLGLSLQTAALGVLLLSAGVTTVVLYRWAASLGFGPYAWLPALLYVFWPRSLTWDTAGMETAFFAMLVTTAFYAQHRRRPELAMGLASLAVLTRIEGVFLVGILGLWNLARGRGSRALVIAIPALVILPWVVYAWVTFGSPVPHSVAAKLALYGRLPLPSFTQDLIKMLAWRNPVGWVHSAAALAGGWWLVRRRRAGGLEILWLAAMLLFFAASRTHLFDWYVIPVYPVYLLLGAAVVPWLAERWSLRGRRQTVASILLGTVVVVVLAPGIERQSTSYRLYQNWMEGVHKQVGLYLAEHADPADVVAAEDIGYMGFYSGRIILDRDGLVSPEAVPYNREGRYADMIYELRPDWVVASEDSPASGFITAPEFLARYEPIEVFNNSQRGAYRIFRARPGGAGDAGGSPAPTGPAADGG